MLLNIPFLCAAALIVLKERVNVKIKKLLQEAVMLNMKSVDTVRLSTNSKFKFKCHKIFGLFHQVLQQYPDHAHPLRYHSAQEPSQIIVGRIPE